MRVDTRDELAPVLELEHAVEHEIGDAPSRDPSATCSTNAGSVPGGLERQEEKRRVPRDGAWIELGAVARAKQPVELRVRIERGELLLLAGGRRSVTTSS